MREMILHPPQMKTALKNAEKNAIEMLIATLLYIARSKLVLLHVL